MNKKEKCFIFFLLISSIKAQDYQEGDDCVDEYTGEEGQCVFLDNCPSAINDLQRGISPQTCSFIGSTPIVCCLKDYEEPEESSPIPSLIEQRLLSVENCIYSPEVITNEDTTGSLVQDYCKALVKTISTCKHVFNDCPREPRVYLQVVGGEPTYTNEFPHMALLGYGKSVKEATWECGGSLITDRWIVTAGHCLYSRSAESDVKYVRLGVDNVSDPIDNGTLFTVTEIVDHPDRNPTEKYNDIALLQLNRNAIIGPAVIPACLHTGLKHSTNGVVTGWGVTKSKGSRSDSLQKVTLQETPHEECAKAHPPTRKSFQGVVNKTQICFSGQTEYKDSCQGDSGGPIQTSNMTECTYTIVGIVSIGKGCAIPGIPGIYTRIAAYIPWIESVVWPQESMAFSKYYDINY